MSHKAAAPIATRPRPKTRGVLDGPLVGRLGRPPSRALVFDLAGSAV